MQAGQDLGVVIMVQTNAADQELLVYLPDHRAGAAGLTLSHSDGHSKGAQRPLNLKKQEKGQALRKHSKRVRRAYPRILSMSKGRNES